MLKKIRENIPLLFKKLSLAFTKNDFRKLDEYLKKKERFFTAIIKTKKGKKLLLKIRLQKNRNVIRDFKKEIELYQFFKENFRGKKNKIIFPKLISFGKYKNLQWCLREYQEGKLAGWIDKDFGLKKDFLKNASPRDLARGISNYQHFSFKRIKKLNLYHQGGWWYWQDFNFYQKTFLKKFLPSNLNQNLLNRKDLEVVKKILRKSKNFLDREAKHLCHGDLYPNNILLAPSKKISILDWGRSNFNNPSFDVAFIYLIAWRDKKWQEEFLKTYLKNQRDKEKFRKLFQISLISLTVRLSGHCYRYLENKRVKKQVFPIFKIFIKNLKTALYDLNKIL